MPKKILQLNFKYTVTTSEYVQAVSPLASEIAVIKGLHWKVWVLNKAEKESGGYYLFDDDASMQAFLAGPIVAQVKSNPALTDISVKMFDTMDKQSAITRGPISD